MKERLEVLLNQIARACETGNRKTLSPLLREIIPQRRVYFHQGQLLGRLAEFTDILCKILWLNLDEEEEESIEIAELAYLGLCEEAGGMPPDYEVIRKRILLIHYFSDYLTDSMINLLLKEYKSTHLLEARRLVINSLVQMQLADLHYLEQRFSEQADNDEALNEACNQLEIDTLPDKQQLADAMLMHQVLHAYLRVKYHPNHSLV